MTPRALRRAQERREKKLARKGVTAATASHDPIAASAPEHATHFEPCPDEALDFNDPEISDHEDISERRLLANCRNALFSTGPTSETGKAKSCLNALKTGLTGQTVLLPTEDAEGYRAHILDYEKELRPVGRRECDLVQSLADTMWRLKRIPRLEMAIYAQGRMEFAEKFNQHDSEQRSSMIEVQTFIAYEKQLRNLQIQEARLHRRYEKDMKALGDLQKERRNREEQELAAAAELYAEARRQKIAFDPAAHGFEFSNAQIEQFINGQHTRYMRRMSATEPFRNPNLSSEAA